MKEYRPITPGRRQMTGTDYRGSLSTSKPAKKLTRALRKTGGRNSSGTITSRHKGGGHKRRYRLVDFKRNEKDDVSANVEAIEYDPSRTAFIARLLYSDGSLAYMLAPQGVSVGDKVMSSAKKLAVRAGNRMPLKFVPVGTFVHDIEIEPGRGGSLVRSAGSSAQVMAREGGLVNLRLPSSEVRKVSEMSRATVGSLSNSEWRMVVLGKAGRSRWMGIRPTVRGSAMNPKDHPLGGGEGRTSAGLKRPKNKWGKGIRGVKTRDKKKKSKIFIVSRRTK